MRKNSRRRCEHQYSQTIGCYYKERLSEWRNDFDTVTTYIRFRCPKCGSYKDIKLGQEQFLPEMYHPNSTAKRMYIERLQWQGYVLEHELALLEYKE